LNALAAHGNIPQSAPHEALYFVHSIARLNEIGIVAVKREERTIVAIGLGRTECRKPEKVILFADQLRGPAADVAVDRIGAVGYVPFVGHAVAPLVLPLEDYSLGLQGAIALRAARAFAAMYIKIAISAVPQGVILCPHQHAPDRPFVVRVSGVNKAKRV